MKYNKISEERRENRISCHWFSLRGAANPSDISQNKMFDLSFDHTEGWLMASLWYNRSYQSKSHPSCSSKWNRVFNFWQTDFHLDIYNQTNKPHLCHAIFSLISAMVLNPLYALPTSNAIHQQEKGQSKFGFICWIFSFYHNASGCRTKRSFNYHR